MSRCCFVWNHFKLYKRVFAGIYIAALTHMVKWVDMRADDGQNAHENEDIFSGHRNLSLVLCLVLCLALLCCLVSCYVSCLVSCLLSCLLSCLVLCLVWCLVLRLVSCVLWQRQGPGLRPGQRQEQGPGQRQGLGPGQRQEQGPRQRQGPVFTWPRPRPSNTQWITKHR